MQSVYINIIAKPSVMLQKKTNTTNN